VSGLRDKRQGKSWVIERAVMGALFVASGSYMTWRSMALMGGDFIIFGWPLLTLSTAAVAVGVAWMAFGARAAKRIAMWACLVSTVPFIVLVVRIWMSPDHGELGGLLLVPLLGAACLLAFFAFIIAVVRSDTQHNPSPPENGPLLETRSAEDGLDGSHDEHSPHEASLIR
jgi:hypothetical protein